MDEKPVEIDLLIIENMQEKTSTFASLKINNDLYDDEAGEKRLPILRVRRIELPKNGEDWEVVKDGESVLRLRGMSLSKKDRAFLRTIQGMSVLLTEYKLGNRSISKIKKRIKELLDND